LKTANVSRSLKRRDLTCWLHPIKTSCIGKNLTSRKLALIVLGSNIWPIVRDHGSMITDKVDAATLGSYDFIEMALPPKFRKKDR